MTYGKFDEEFEAFYPQLLQKLPYRAPGKIAAFKDDIKQTLVKTWANKVKMREALAMPDDLRIKFDTSNPKLIEAQANYKIIQNGLLALPEKFVTEDAAGRNLTKMIMDNMITVGKREMRFSKFVLPTLIKHNPTVNWQLAFSQLGELVGQQKREVVLTVNPLDIIFSTENSGYTSCYRLQGPHGMGNLSYLYDDFTAMTYIMGDNKQKIARSFVYFNPANYKEFILGKVYGLEQGPTAKMISSSLIDHLGNPKGAMEFNYEVTNKDQLRDIASRLNPDHRRYAGFFDIATAGRFVNESKNKMWAMNFNRGICLTCAKAIDANRETSHSCVSCEAKHQPIRCRACGCNQEANQVFKLEPGYADDNRYRMCDPCYAQRYAQCVRCNGYSTPMHMHEKHCRNCTDQVYAKDFRGRLVKRDKLVACYNISGKQVFAEAKAGALPTGLYKSLEDVKAAAETARAERKKILAESEDKFGAIQFAFESEIVGKFKAPKDLAPYRAALAELIALDNN